MKLASFEAIVRALDSAGVRYLVVGGLAVNAHGFGRLTYDVDLVIRLELGNVRAAFTALRGADYHPAVPIVAEEFADPAKRESWRVEKGMLVLKFWSDRHREPKRSVDGRRQTPLDVFITEPFPFEEEWRQARREELTPGLTVPYVRLETLLAMKREAGRGKDLIDIDELNLLYGRPSAYDDPQP